MTETDGDQEQTPEDVFRTAIGVEVGLGVVAVVLGYLLGPSARDLIPPWTLVASPAIWGGLGLGILATLPLLMFIAGLRRIDHPAIRELDRLGENPMIQLMLRLSLLELVVISLCAGVGEELLFRGWLMPWLAGANQEGIYWLTANPDVPPTWFALGGWLGQPASAPFMGLSQWWSESGGWSLFIAWIASSAFFGFFHPITKLYIVVTALMGLYFGLLLILTGNLLVPIVAHALYDAVQLWWAAKEERSLA